MKKISSLIILLAVLFAVSNIYSQPQMKIHVYGGYNVPLAGLGGNSKFPSTDPTTHYAYMKSGFNAGADFKYFLGKKRNVGLLINAAYNGYSTGDLKLTDGTAFGKYALNNVRIGIGAEYDFMPKKKANPFIGIDLTGNFLTGKFTPANGGTELNLHSSSRFGFAVGAGVDIMVNKSFGFVIGAKFDWMNLLGKQDTSATFTQGTEYPLVDKAYDYTDPAGNTVSVKAVEFMDVQFYGGVTFAFGQPKKMVKK